MVLSAGQWVWWWKLLWSMLLQGIDATIKLFDAGVGLDSAMLKIQSSWCWYCIFKNQCFICSQEKMAKHSSGNENSILSGSYDDTLINDLRMIGSQICPGLVKPVIKSQTLGVGVWRLMDLEESDELLVCYVMVPKLQSWLWYWTCFTEKSTLRRTWFNVLWWWLRNEQLPISILATEYSLEKMKLY